MTDNAQYNNFIIKTNYSHKDALSWKIRKTDDIKTYLKDLNRGLTIRMQQQKLHLVSLKELEKRSSSISRYCPRIHR
jgi:hypothetical protein